MLRIAPANLISGLNGPGLIITLGCGQSHEDNNCILECLARAKRRVDWKEAPSGRILTALVPENPWDHKSIWLSRASRPILGKADWDRWWIRFESDQTGGSVFVSIGSVPRALKNKESRDLESLMLCP
jgi:hypothetical protein